MSNRLQRWDPTAGWLFAALILGLVIRLIGLEQQSLWLDEMTSIQMASRPISEIVTGRGFDNHTPPLYYVLLHLVGAITPLTEFSLRLVSVCIDLGNTVLLWLLCARFVERRSALLITSAYAISPFALYYAQEGRMYTLAVFFALLLTMALDRVVNCERRLVGWTIAAGAVFALGVYTHYYIVFYALGVFSVALFAARRSYHRIVAVVLSGLLAVVIFAPWIPIALQLMVVGGQSFRTHLFSVIPYTFFRFVIGYAVFPLNMHTKEDFVGAVVAHAPYVVAVFTTLVLLGFALISRNTLRNRFVVSVGWVSMLPMALGLLISLKVPMISERYLVVSFPAFLVLCLGFQDFVKKRSVIAVGFFFILLVMGDVAYFFNPLFGKAQWRDTASYVERTLEPDGIVFVQPDFAGPLFKYYFRGPQVVHSFSLLEFQKRRVELEPLLQKHFRAGRHAILVTSGPANPDVGYARVLMKYAEKTQIRVFELETGITCTTWKRTEDDHLDNGKRQERATETVKS